MNAATLTALIIAITGLAGAIPAIVIAFRSNAKANAAHSAAMATTMAMSAHAKDDHGAEYKA